MVSFCLLLLWKQFYIMALKKESEYESVKIKTAIVDKVRANKKKTGVPVATFFEMAAEKELSKPKK